MKGLGTGKICRFWEDESGQYYEELSRGLTIQIALLKGKRKKEQRNDSKSSHKRTAAAVAFQKRILSWKPKNL